MNSGLQNRLMTVCEVAEFVGCHQETIRRARACEACSSRSDSASEADAFIHRRHIQAAPGEQVSDCCSLQLVP